MEMNLVEQFKESLFEKSVDLVTDYAEIGIDNLLESISECEILQDIPIIKTVYSVCKVGLAIQEKHLLRKTLVFINEFNSKTIESKKLEKYKKKFKKHPFLVQEELGRVLLLLDKIIDDGKATILAKLYRNYIEEKINWEEFCELTDITKRLFLTDIKVLKHSYKNNGVDLGDFPNYHLDRLIGLGLLENYYRLGGNIIISGGSSEEKESNNKDVKITELGKLLFENGLR